MYVEYILIDDGILILCESLVGCSLTFCKCVPSQKMALEYSYLCGGAAVQPGHL